MKKFLVLLMVMCSYSLVINAQPPIRYQGDAQVGYSLGIGTFDIDRVNFQYINSARIGDYFSAGVGTGLDLYLFKSYGYYDDSSAELALPIYLNTRGYLPASSNIELFLSFDIGASIGLTEGMSDISGLLLSPSVGTRFKLDGNKAISLGLGYVHQKWSESLISINTDAMQLKVGFSF